METGNDTDDSFSRVSRYMYPAQPKYRTLFQQSLDFQSTDATLSHLMSSPILGPILWTPSESLAPAPGVQIIGNFFHF